MSDVAAGTIVAKSYLSYARVLADSFREHHPDIPFFVLLADEVGGYFDPGKERYELLSLSDLRIRNLERFRFLHAQQPLSYAATPYLLAHLLNLGFSRVLFFKQEGLVVGQQTPALEALQDHSIVLTPHLAAPLAGPGHVERELNVLQSGVFNIGLVGVAESPTARRFLDWWQDRVYRHCRWDVAAGLHYEQRWIDLVPSFFQDVAILRDPVCNIGHWNVSEHRVEIDHGVVTVDGRLCRLFRFSGFDPDDPTALTRYSSRLLLSDVGGAAAVFDLYRGLLLEAGYRETSGWPYAYGAFDNGVPVPDLARALYHDLGEEVAAFGDPLQTSSANSLFCWLNEPIDDEPDRLRRITRLWHAVYLQRTDVRRAFPDVLERDREGFLAWTVTSGVSEHGIAERFLGHRPP